MRSILATLWGLWLTLAATSVALASQAPSVLPGSDPTVGLIPSSSDGYANWSGAGLNAIPLIGSITATTLIVTYTPSHALGPGQTLSFPGVIGSPQITAFGTGTGGAGTYTINTPEVVAAGTAMTANGIPNRTKIYRTLSPNGSDDTSAINAALAACPAGQVVQLTTGIFRISGNGISFHTSDCTLRGSGPGSQKNTGLNPVNTVTSYTVNQGCSGLAAGGTTDEYCPDSTATQLIKNDRATNAQNAVLYVRPVGNTLSTSYNLASDAVQGAYSVTLTSTPSPPIKIGDMVVIDEVTDNDPNVVWGPSFGPPGDGSRRWFTAGPMAGTGMNRQDRSLVQWLEVSAVNGAKITFDTPLTYPYHTAYTAQLTTFNGTFLHGAGVENLFVWGGMGGDGNGNIAVSFCAYCWVKNVEASWSIGSDIGFYQTFRNVLRDSFVHETPTPNPGGAGYLTTLTAGASENLIENNIFWYGNKVNTMRASGGGNVFAYNYTDDSFDGTNPQEPEAGINAAHYTTSHLELLEGNYSPNFKGDTYWGNSIFITAFRNWLSGRRASHAPLNTYRYALGCGVLPYGDYAGRTAVDVQAYSYDNNFVGNVLGMSGQQLLSWSSTACFYGVQGAFRVGVYSTTEWDSSNNADDVPMWQVGSYQASVNTRPCSCWTFVDTTIKSETRNGNWDWYSQSQDWYGTGGGTDTGKPLPIPKSFYLTSKPAFFGSNQWPWVNPATGATYTLPAMYCFRHGEMPTCLE